MKRILRAREVQNKTGLPNSTMYEHIAKNNFPKPIPLGQRSVGWLESEINNWIETRIEMREGGHND